MHEVVFSARRQKAQGVSATDIAKRLLDLGFYAPSIYFPLIVDEALMIEPTETESKETLDQFCDAMIQDRQGGGVEPGDPARGAGDDAGAAARPDPRGAAAEPPVDAAGAGFLRTRGRAPRRGPAARGSGRRLSGAMGPAWRLLITEPLDGATNMAVDEALLRWRIRGTGAPTVRFYGWRPATVSLGYAQPVDETVDRARCDALGLGLVRRPTGGSAILHALPEGEVTYSVVARGGDFPGAEDVLETYRVIGQGLQAGLGRLGVATELVPLVRGRRDLAALPVFCFRRAGAYEIAVGGRKLVGSAQRRQRGAFLQHGSVVLDADAARIRAVFPREPEPMAGMTTLAAVLGSRPRFDTVVAALAAGLAEALGSPLAPGGLSPEERRWWGPGRRQVRHGGLDSVRPVAGRAGSAGVPAGTAAGPRTDVERPAR